MNLQSCLVLQKYICISWMINGKGHVPIGNLTFKMFCRLYDCFLESNLYTIISDFQNDYLYGVGYIKCNLFCLASCTI